MDIGLVCDQCDTFNPMTTQACAACGAPLSLGGGKKSTGNQPKMPSSSRPAQPAPISAARPAAGAPATAAAAARPNAAPVRGPSPAVAPAAAKAPAPLPGMPPKVAPAPATAKPTGKPSPVPQPIAGPSTTPHAATRTCGECGSLVQASFKFCGTCGARVDDGRPATPPAVTPPSGGPQGAIERRTMFFGQMQAARAKLVLIKGDGLDGLSYTLAGQDHIAGRVEGPLLFREDPFLSPRHANFFYTDSKLHVRDESSANGIFIRIRAPMPIRTADTFLIGEQILRVETTPPEAAGLGPDEEGTYYFASPRRSAKMRLIQLLRGGDTGLIPRSSGEQVSLGREGNDINFPDDPFISGKHAQVSFSDAGLMLTDLGSKNGTFLRINKEAALNHGDYIFMGQQLLRVEIV